jgi:competence protein ComEC
MKLPQLSPRSRTILTIFAVGIVFDVLVWHSVLLSFSKATKIHFLDVGQGDSQLIVLPGKSRGQSVKILSDAGPDGKVVESLSRVLPQTDRYIDLLVLSHPQADHFNGFIEVMKRYEVGALIFNGRNGTAKSWEEFESVVRERRIPVIIAREGDMVRYAENELRFISPDSVSLKSKELNDTVLVGLLSSNNAKTLLTADIDAKLERRLARKYDLDVDILKVAHHGSKYSSAAEFVNAISPKIAVVQVGKNNYGHPTKDALAHLASAGARIYRNDKNGTITVTIDGKYIGVKKEKG